MTRPVAGWELNLALVAGFAGARSRASALGPEQALPHFLAIARAIAEDARTGRLAPGSRLPGSRELARSLRVHRNTVLAAYRELMAEGFLDTEPGRGTYLTKTLPEQKPRSWSKRRATRADPASDRSRPGFAFQATDRVELARSLPRGALGLFGGVPDTRLLPRASLARAYRRALLRKPELLNYGDPLGQPALRRALAEMLRARRGLRVTADDVLITRGAQMALALLGRLLIRPGDVIAVEQYGYQPAFRSLAQGVATLKPIGVDREGLRVDELAALCEREPVRAVYVTPHHQYPTTVTLSPARRMALLQLAEQRRIAIIEDDYDHEFHYEGRPILPLASADRANLVCYVGTLSKVFAPGPRIGYLIAPGPVRDAAVRARFDLDRQGDHLGEHALAELIEDGELQRHMRRTQRVYHARRDHAVALLRAQLGPLLSFEVPSGGMALWTQVARELPVDAWLTRAEQLGVFTQPGRLFTLDGRASANVRLGFAALDEQEFAQAVARLRRASDEVLRASAHGQANAGAARRRPLRKRAAPRTNKA
jgi:GntR family transcriptional regulator/MocR family aminotransferase